MSAYRLCPRCAKQQHHEVALAEYHQHRAEQDRRRQEKRRQEEVENQRRSEELQARLDAFFCDLLERLPEVGGGGLYALRVEYKGHIYEIKEVEE